VSCCGGIHDGFAMIVCSEPRYSTPSVPGSTLGNCHRCHRPVWVSPSSHGIMASMPAVIICADCALAGAREEGGGTLLPLTPLQRAELEEAGVAVPDWLSRGG
jgi:hypothetical protein